MSTGGLSSPSWHFSIGLIYRVVEVIMQAMFPLAAGRQQINGSQFNTKGSHDKHPRWSAPAL